MKYAGRISRVFAVKSGVSARTGNSWKSMPFVFQYYENEDARYPDSVYLETMDTGVMSKIGKYLKKGDDGKAIVTDGEMHIERDIKATCSWYISAIEMNRDGKKSMYNQIRAYGIDIAEEAEQPKHEEPKPAAPAPAPAPDQAPAAPAADEDDLPF